MANCPKCEAALTNVGAVDINVGGRWNGVGYTCPHCSTLLSVSVDPVALKADTVNEISKHVDDALSQIQYLLQQVVHRLNQMRTS